MRISSLQKMGMSCGLAGLVFGCYFGLAGLFNNTSMHALIGNQQDIVGATLGVVLGVSSALLGIVFNLSRSE